MADITIQGVERSRRQVIVIFRRYGSEAVYRMLAGDMLRSPMIVELLTNVDLATVGKLYATEFGG